MKTIILEMLSKVFWGLQYDLFVGNVVDFFSSGFLMFSMLNLVEVYFLINMKTYIITYQYSCDKKKSLTAPSFVERPNMSVECQVSGVSFQPLDQALRTQYLYKAFVCVLVTP